MSNKQPTEHTTMAFNLNTHNSAEYLAAIDAHNAAFAVYNPVRNAFHAGDVDSTTYCAARAIYFAAGQDFDKAFAKEARLDPQEHNRAMYERVQAQAPAWPDAGAEE